MRMHAWFGVLILVVCGACTGAARAADLEAPTPPWKARIHKTLEKKVSFSFVDTPLAEALQFLHRLTGVNIILDPQAGAGHTPINLTIKGMTLDLSLKWILKLSGLDYALMNEAVYISDPDKLIGDVRLKIYDVGDMIMQIPDFPGLNWYPPLSGVDMGFLFHGGQGDPDASSLAEMIQIRVQPDSWAPELATSIEQHGSRLVVMQRPEVHRLIGRLLKNYRDQQTHQVRVEARLLAVPETLLARMRGARGPGRRTVYLGSESLGMLEKALASGKADRVAAMQTLCMNGQMTHVYAGSLHALSARGKDKMPPWKFLRVSDLTLRPRVSSDRKYVTVNMHLRRIDGHGGAFAPIEDFHFATTFTCLSTDTVLLAGSPIPGDGAPKRLIALVTPTVLELNEAPAPQRSAAESRRDKGKAAADKARREAVRRIAEKHEHRKPVPAWKKKIRAALDRRVSFDFAETPLREALRRLRSIGGATLVLDPRAFEAGGDEDMPITLSVTDMRFGAVLKWMLRLAELDHVLKNEAIFISTPQNLAGAVDLKTYDVRDLSLKIQHNPGPDILAQAVPGEIPIRRLGDKDGPEAAIIVVEPPGEGLHAGSLAELIQTRVRPDSWAVELGTSIEERDGRLVVMQRPEVQQEISRLIDDLRQDYQLQVRVEARLLWVSEALLAKVAALAAKPLETNIALSREQLDLLDEAQKEGKAARLLEAAHIHGYNGQRNYTVAGRKVWETADDGKKRLVLVRGAVLDVLPVISFDRKFITTEIRLTRVDGRLASPTGSRVFQSAATVRCPDGGTFLWAGSSDAFAGGEKPDVPGRMIVLVTPTVLHLEPSARTVVKDSSK